MPRDIVIGNGRIAIALDSNLSIRDFFYPTWGLENHVSGRELKVGVWVDGHFGWLGRGWKIEPNYVPSR